MREKIPACKDHACSLVNPLRPIQDIWPLEFLGSELKRNSTPFTWRVFIRYEGGQGKHRDIFICWTHHDWLYKMWDSEMAADVREMEQTERWAIRQGGRI